MKKIKIRPVANWKRCPRWLSVAIPTVNLTFLSTWAALPSKFQDALPMPWMLAIAIVLIVLGVAGRLIDQGEGDADRSVG